MSVRDAIVLAAGMGTRLRGVVDDRPKGLLELDGEPLVGRSLRLLRHIGIERVLVVAGFRSDLYQEFVAGQKDVRVLLNPEFATTGSMASLDIALGAIPDRDVLVVESDLVYEARALALASAPDVDSTMVSGPTGAGDEVWVSAPDGWLVAMSKTRSALPDTVGEFVGITRLSAGAAAAMREAFHFFVRSHGHGRMDYETGALVEIAQRRAIRVHLVKDLCWGEIDNHEQYTRVLEKVWPAVRTRDDRVQ